MNHYTQPVDIADVKQYQYVNRQLKVYVYHNREYIPLNCNTVTNSPTTDPNVSYVTLDISDSVDTTGLDALTSGADVYKEIVVIQSSTYNVPFRCVRYKYNTDNIRMGYEQPQGFQGFTPVSSTVVTTLHDVAVDHNARIPDELQLRLPVVTGRYVDGNYILDNISNVDVDAYGIVKIGAAGCAVCVNEPLHIPAGKSVSILDVYKNGSVAIYLKQGVCIGGATNACATTLQYRYEILGRNLQAIGGWDGVVELVGAIQRQEQFVYDMAPITFAGGLHILKEL